MDLIAVASIFVTVFSLGLTLVGIPAQIVKIIVKREAANHF